MMTAMFITGLSNADHVKTIICNEGTMSIALTLIWAPMPLGARDWCFAWLSRALLTVPCCRSDRGSLSFGQGSIRALRGRCGSLDVEDCMTVLADAASKGLCDPARTCFFGGSHSGFLGGHVSPTRERWSMAAHDQTATSSCLCTAEGMWQS